MFGFQMGGMGGPGGGYPGSQPHRAPRKPRRFVVKSPVARVLVNLLVTLVFGFVYFYLELPPLNFQAKEFYVFVFLLCAVYCASAIFTSGFESGDPKGYFTFVKKQCTLPFFVVVGLAVVVLVGSLLSWEVIRAGSYSKLLTVETGDFASEVDEIRYDQIPMLDADSAQRLGSRKLGELADMVSQFEILPTYTQINYQGRPVRVTSLAYGDIIKWFTNRSEGLPAYLIIDMVTQ